MGVEVVGVEVVVVAVVMLVLVAVVGGEKASSGGRRCGGEGGVRGSSLQNIERFGYRHALSLYRYYHITASRLTIC